MCFSLTIVNIGTESLEGYFALNFFLSAGNFSPTEATADNDFDAFGVGTH